MKKVSAEKINNKVEGEWVQVFSDVTGKPDLNS
jgi:hypothetical protein